MVKPEVWGSCVEGESLYITCSVKLESKVGKKYGLKVFFSTE